MLELQNIGFSIRKAGKDIPLLQEISTRIHPRHFMAIVGPSGCGKTTLLKTIAGINHETEGDFHWNGRNLAQEGDFKPNELGYVPQFSIAYGELSVYESVLSAAQLRLGGLTPFELEQRVDQALAETGLSALGERRTAILSGGQLRRLGLAMELVAAPQLLLCDEVTSGLDPNSEKDIVYLLRSLSRRSERTVISVTHSLAHFHLYDSVLVLVAGRLAYHGPPKYLNHYFSIEQSEDLYQSLSQKLPEEWAQYWLSNQGEYDQAMVRAYLREHEVSGVDEVENSEESSFELNKTLEFHDKKSASLDFEDKDKEEELEILVQKGEAKSDTQLEKLPNPFSQCLTLLRRRSVVFFRDRGQVWLQIAIILCFPILVTLFSDRGKDEIAKLAEGSSTGVIERIEAKQQRNAGQMKVGADVSGIIMFQVILLALMGSNNAAREIAGERLIMEKEKLGGLASFAYLASKLLFLTVLVTLQSIWMAFFVELFWPFRGDFVEHAFFLFAMNASITAICLGISALMRGPSQASLLAIYFVGFQLPLSGAVLALPEVAERVVQPFISAYWAWNGSVQSLQEEINFAVGVVSETQLYSAQISVYVLGIHILAGVLMTYIGIRRKQWPH